MIATHLGAVPLLLVLGFWLGRRAGMRRCARALAAIRYSQANQEG